MFRSPSLRPSYQKSLPTPQRQKSSQREKYLFLLSFFAFLLILSRFFYLQIVRGQEYAEQSQQHYQQIVPLTGERGKIYTSDNFLLAGNHVTYILYVAARNAAQNPDDYYQKLTSIIQTDVEATPSIKPLTDFKSQVLEKQNGTGVVLLAKKINLDTKTAIQDLALTGLQFEKENIRFYPEGSLAAQTLGFLSHDGSGGRYGIEGKLNKELEGKLAQSVRDVDAFKNPIFLSPDMIDHNLDGWDIYLTLRHDLQLLAEKTLSQDLEKYGASRGEIIITEPKTGKILALATFPNYEPAQYYNYSPDLYKNPAITDLFEPGSTFKILTVAAGIDAGLISPTTTCPRCGGPRAVGDTYIKTWNEVYHPNITVREALEKSDNTAMVYISDLLGPTRFREYLQIFGIGQPLSLELEEESPANFPQVWGVVETATRSFGQGVSLTSLQLIRAVGAIANNGVMMKPYLVEKADSHNDQEPYLTAPESLGQVIKPETARIVSEMMQTAASHGEAQYLYKNTSLIAGKTGTAQIPEAGGYSDDTIASFIGFAPYNDPKFLMLIKFERPRSSPWAAETAALTWNNLAQKLFIIFNIN